MIGRQRVVDEVVRFAEGQRSETAVVLWQLLLDDVGLDGDADVVGLAGEIGCNRVIGALVVEGPSCEDSTRGP